MRHALISFAFCALAAPVGAQLTTTYTGVQRVGDKEYPATAVFSVEKGRIAMVLTGAKHVRMLFDDKAQILRMVSDDDKQYIDLTKDFQASIASMVAQMSQMQKQLESLPKEQRAMAESMMKQAMAGRAAAEEPLVYVWTKNKQKISGYDCTFVEGMRGTRKVTEYCGTTSNDFQLSDADHQTLLDMQGYLRNFLIMVHSNDESNRAFAWDASQDGYPVLSRCLEDGKITLDLTLSSLARKGPTDDLFNVSGLKKMDMPKGPGGN